MTALDLSPTGPSGEDPLLPVSPTPRRLRFEEALREGRAGIVATMGEARIELGLSYRKLERLVDIRVPTLQGWLTGHYIPQVGMRQDFGRLVRALDLADGPATPGGVGEQHWWQAFRAERPAGAPGPARPAPAARDHLRSLVRLDHRDSTRLLAWQRHEIPDPGARLRRLMEPENGAVLVLTTCDCSEQDCAPPHEG